MDGEGYGDVCGRQEGCKGVRSRESAPHCSPQHRKSFQEARSNVTPAYLRVYEMPFPTLSCDWRVAGVGCLEVFVRSSQDHSPAGWTGWTAETEEGLSMLALARETLTWETASSTTHRSGRQDTRGWGGGGRAARRDAVGGQAAVKYHIHITRQAYIM